jgi:hypothetical protein
MSFRWIAAKRFFRPKVKVIHATTAGILLQQWSVRLK